MSTSTYLDNTLRQLNTFNLDECRDRMLKKLGEEGQYPGLCGALSVMFKSALKLAQQSIEAVKELECRNRAMEWVAETILREDEYERFYEATDIVVEALKNGMTDAQLRAQIKDLLGDLVND